MSKYHEGVGVYIWGGIKFLSTYETKRTIFWYTTPCRLLKVNQNFGSTHRLHLQGRRIRDAKYQRKSRWQAELKMEAICSSETSVNFQPRR
jgi:hypothetical protein